MTMPVLQQLELFRTYVSPEAIERVNQVLRSGWLSEGRVVKEFEEALTKRLGFVNPVAVNSGTSALHLALVIAGVGPGDEVILPAQTFIATGLAVLMQQAKPVFVDINPTTGNLDPAAAARAITPRTKAIMAVHWAGYPCELQELNAIADRAGIPVIEDAAHALGATYQGQPIGSVSRFTAFSFQAIKHLTTGDGGALCCRNDADANTAMARRWFGVDRLNSRPSELGERIYDIRNVGYKYHMNDLAAAVGVGNLEGFDQRLARRQAIGAFYRQQLARVSGLELLQLASNRTHAYWLLTILVERREEFIRKLAESGIPASVVHLRIDRNTVFGGLQDLPGQQEFDARQVSLPVHDGLTDDDAARVVQAIRAGW